MATETSASNNQATPKPDPLAYTQDIRRDQVLAVSNRILQEYPKQLEKGRTISLRSRFPICHPDGRPGDSGMMWSFLKGEGFTEYREKNGMLSALIGEEYRYSVTAGRGMMEIAIEDCQTVHELSEKLVASVDRLVVAAEKWKQVILGYGAQPKQKIDVDCLTHKFEYFSLLRKIKEPYLYQGVQATTCIEFSVGRDELLEQLNWGHLLVPLFLGWSSNSPIMGGEDMYQRSSRWWHQSQLDVGDGRWQMLGEAYSSLEEWVFHMFAQPHLLLRDAEGWLNPAENYFGGYASQEDMDSVWTHFLDHMETIWTGTQPKISQKRLQFAEIEQGDVPMQLAFVALGLGLVEEKDACLHWLEDLVPDPPEKREFGLYPEDILRRNLQYSKDIWTPMQKYLYQLSKKGLLFPEPYFGLFDGILDCAKLGLQKRGLGEEMYLEPLYQRIQQQIDPTVEIRRQWILGGYEALVQATKIARSKISPID